MLTDLHTIKAPAYAPAMQDDMISAMATHRLSAREREQLQRDGYVVRPGVFDSAELHHIRADCEALVERVTGSRAAKVPMGSYLFQTLREPLTVAKWEPDHPDSLQGVEPFAHFDESLRAWGNDPRFVDPMRDLLPTDEPELFTEKLNLKRARVGGPIVLHQDYPYWVDNSDNPAEIATALLFLDDTTRSNGCLEVWPGSHRLGVHSGKDEAGFGRFEIDPSELDESTCVALELSAGSIAFFGSLLVHRSAPNSTEGDRRTLLYSYQPAGRQRSFEFLERLLSARAQSTTPIN